MIDRFASSAAGTRPIPVRTFPILLDGLVDRDPPPRVPAAPLRCAFPGASLSPPCALSLATPTVLTVVTGAKASGLK